MKLLDIVDRSDTPLPWEEGDNIPWHEPGFSTRMLVEHLAQNHDLASRRSHIIDQHVAWLHEVILGGKPARILDLGCGPGLYCNRLATLGHRCVGIDYSPASIGYAKKSALVDGATDFRLQDLRAADYGQDFDLALLIYGELNVFARHDATHILSKAYTALRPGGVLLLEAHTQDAFVPKPDTARTWYSSPGGLFSPTPHIVLVEQHWDRLTSILTRRYYVVNAEGGDVAGTVTRYAQSMQAYTEEEYTELLAAVGFAQVDFMPGLAHDRLEPPANLVAIVATKPS